MKINPALLPPLKWIYTRLYEPVVRAFVPGRPRYFPYGAAVFLTFNERRTLHRFARSAAGGTVVEIGCYNGGSTYFLCDASKQTGAHVVAIDPFADAI